MEGSRVAAEDADGAKAAACHFELRAEYQHFPRKMSDRQGAVDSCLEALEIDPSNTKALY